MPHTVPNPHDAEETMRPYLGDVHALKLPRLVEDEAQENDEVSPEWDYIYALEAALDKALELLGVLGVQR